MHALIRWFARNPVAANLLMVFIIVWGLASLNSRIPLEVFPSFELDRISVEVPFRGATPYEVESGVTIKVEEAIQDITGIERIESVAREGLASIQIEIDSGVETLEVLDEVKQRIDGIANFPDEIDTPRITVPEFDREVISVIVAGELPERELRQVAERVRDDIEDLPTVTSVALSGARSYEIAIEVSPAQLERQRLTLAEVVDAIEANSLDLAAGTVASAGGDILLRTRGQSYEVEDFARIPIRTRADGSRIALGDIAEIRDGFEENALQQTFNGLPAIEIDVYRTGLQSAITVADEVKRYLADAGVTMTHGVTLDYWRDSSRTVRARLDTLLSSALQGGLLIMLLLTLFLRFWVAVWVFVGVPVSILGGMAIMPLFGVSLNLLSLFAFILVLGIVVDDAIVTGENIYSRMRRDPDRVQAAIDGTVQVALPVTFGVLTTVAAFTPLLMIDGARGQIFAQIPLIVIPVLLFSIVESKFVLPSHMSHLNIHDAPANNPLSRLQRRIADGFEWGIEHVYQPMLAGALTHRYTVLAGFVGVAIIVFTLVAAGHIRFVFFPRVQSERATATLEMPEGTPFAETRRHIERISAAVKTLQARYVDPETGESVVESVLAIAGGGGQGEKGSHLGRVRFEIVPPESRTIDVSSRELVTEWQREIGDIPGARSLSFRAEIGRGGSPVDVEIAGFEFAELEAVAGRVKAELARYPGISEISDTFEGGKEEIRLALRPEARALSLSLADVARQVRIAYLGEEVQSVQRNRNDVAVMVRYPERQRQSLAALERLDIRTPGGVDVPLGAIATLTWDQGLPEIRRVDRRRTLNVLAEADKETANIEGIKADLDALAAELENAYPDVRLSLEGEAREQRESFASLRVGLVLVLLVIYTLLAIPFKSYLQPLLVMVVIPFGVVGGVLGHMIMDMSLSIMSYMGMLALCGVVVNDSLVLVDWVNKQRTAGLPLLDAVRTAGVARFRAVILTSLTTFFGLIPLIFETSTQAQFMIPMAVSLGYGILFATVVTLVLIPINYLVLEDLRALGRRLLGRSTDRVPAAGA